MALDNGSIDQMENGHVKYCPCPSIVVHNVLESPFYYSNGAPPVSGLSRDTTAILVGVIAGLVTFIFLALLILHLLWPRNKDSRKQRGSNRATDAESLLSYRSCNQLMNPERFREVDMKLPRAWLQTLSGVPESQLDKRISELEKTSWDYARRKSSVIEEGEEEDGDNRTDGETGSELHGEVGGAAEASWEELDFDLKQQVQMMKKENFMKIYLAYRRSKLESYTYTKA